MPIFKFKSPQGETINVESDSENNAIRMLTTHVIPDMQRQAAQPQPTPPQPEIAPPQSQQLQGPPEPVPTSQTPIAPRTGMPWYQKLQEGVGTGMINTYYGAKNLTGLGDEEDKLKQQQIQEYQKGLGGFGAAGGLVGEGLATAPIGGVVGGGAKLLTKALPALAKVGSYGGRVANVGTAGRAATEGALSAAVTGGDAVEGGAYGTGAAATMAAVAKPLQLAGKAFTGVRNAISGSTGPVEQRTYKALERTLGGEKLKASETASGVKTRQGLEDVMRALEHASPSSLPRTTAVMSGSPILGALERGAPSRGLVDFNPHYEDVARTAWKELTSLNKPSQAQEALEGTFMRSGIPKTRQMYGTDENMIPVLESQPFRQALSKYAPHMKGDEQVLATKLAQDIHAQDVVRTGQGAATPNLGRGTDLISAALAAASIGTASPTLWKVRSAFNAVSGGAKKSTFKEIDEALLDPDRFMALVKRVQAKDMTGKPLTRGEELLKESLLTGARGAAVKEEK